MKYIDTDKLIALIDAKLEDLGLSGSIWVGRSVLQELKNDIITSLQQEKPDCHTVEEWMQHIKNSDPLTKDVFSKGPYDVLYDALNYPYQYCYDAIKEFGELCFQTGVNSIKQEQSEVDDIKREWYNKGYLKGRQEAHIPARELGLPKALDFKPFDEDLERDAVNFCHDNGLNTTPHIAKTIAKHFYELGLNTRE